MKTLKTIQKMTLFAAVGFGLAVAGCDSGASCADGGVCADAGLGGAKGGGAGGAGVGGAGGTTLFGLTAGTYCFDIKAVSAVTDGCMLGLATSVVDVASIPVTYTAATGVVAVGTDGSLGQGAIANNMGTLVRSGATGDGLVCTWTQMDTSALTMTANNAFTISVSETESTFAAACVPPPPSDPCSSAWTWTMAIHAPAKIPDAVNGCK